MTNVAKIQSKNFEQGDMGLWGQIFLLLLDKHYKNPEYGPRNWQVKPLLGLELKNNGQKLLKKWAKQHNAKKVKKVKIIQQIRPYKYTHQRTKVTKRKTQKFWGAQKNTIRLVPSGNA